MITFVNDDLLNTSHKYICHQVNCKGVMGSGVAKQIRDKWPEVYDKYKEFCKGNIIYNNPTSDLLGKIQVYPINENQKIVNMFAQNDYGRNRRYTSYDAFWVCLGEILKITKPGDNIAFPFGIGCGLGGANWEVICKMIEIALKDRNVFIYCKCKIIFDK